MLPEGRFVTTFIGLLDQQTHRLRFLSGGQGPILHFGAAAGDCAVYRATSFPVVAMPIRKLRPAVELSIEPGDWLVLMSDGIYEYAERAGELLDRTPRGLPQDDDILLVLLRREPSTLVNGLSQDRRSIVGSPRCRWPVPHPSPVDRAVDMTVTELDGPVIRVGLSGRLDAPGADQIGLRLLISTARSLALKLVLEALLMNRVLYAFPAHSRDSCLKRARLVDGGAGLQFAVQRGFQR